MLVGDAVQERPIVHPEVAGGLRIALAQAVDPSAELILIHVRLALDRAKRNAGPTPDIRLGNLEQVDSWLKNPKVLNAVENWPSRN